MVAARKALRRLVAATAYNRGQVIYRIAEMLEGRRAAVRRPARRARPGDRATVDRGDRPAGALRGLDRQAGRGVRRRQPGAGPYFSLSTPEPTGVVAAIAPQERPLLGLVSVIGPDHHRRQHRGGHRRAARRRWRRSTLAEVLATSDLPGGVVNILTGTPAEIAPHLAAHGDVNALDLTGADAELRTELERAAADTVKRVYAPAAHRTSPGRPGPPGCGRSWRSRPSGTRPAPCRWPVAARIEHRRPRMQTRAS